MCLLESLTYKNGHQELNPGGHSFVFLNVSINKKPVFFSEVVTFKKGEESASFCLIDELAIPLTNENHCYQVPHHY
jgi:hypothetical protein